MMNTLSSIFWQYHRARFYHFNYHNREDVSQFVSIANRPIKPSKILASIFIVIVSIFNSMPVSSRPCKQGDHAFKYLLYSQAIQEYNDCFKSANDLDLKAIQNLAHCYRMLDQPAMASIWYRKAMNIKGNDIKNAYYYVTSLHTSGQTFLSQTMIDSLLMKHPKDKRLMSLKSLVSPTWDADSFHISKVAFNSLEADFAPTWMDNGLIFGSTRPSHAKTDFFTGQDYATIWYYDTLTHLSTPWTKLSSTKYNIGTIAQSPDKTYLLFSANLPKINKKGQANLAIYIQDLTTDPLREPKLWKESIGTSNDTHPTISPDGKLLVFASDKDGHAMDLFYCTKTKTGTWSSAKALSKNINTYGNEVFPAFISNQKLIFSSDGIQDSGSLDMYSTTFDNGAWTMPMRLSAPLNSINDDYGIATDADIDHGFFTSNRSEVSGNEDIYEFRRIKRCHMMIELIDRSLESQIISQPFDVLDGKKMSTIMARTGRGYYDFYPSGDIKISSSYVGISYDTTLTVPKTCQGDTMSIVFSYYPAYKNLTGITIDPISHTFVPNVTLDIVDQITRKRIQITSDENGKYDISLISGRNYLISPLKNQYFGEPMEINIGTDKSKPKENVDISLKKIDINHTFILKNILYDFDDSQITPTSEIDLNLVVTLIAENPTIKVELSSHTDARGNDDYNIKLSDKRAKAAVDYIVSKGIKRSQIYAKGYGESKHVNECGNGVKCTEDQHQENRRTEIRIVAK